MSKQNCKKYFIIYETTNLLNEKIYVGKHWTYTPYEFDGYLGSGNLIKLAIKKYGKENFKRETLFVFENEDLAFLKEKELVDTEFVRRKDTYNLCEGGYGFAGGEKHPMYGKRGKDTPRFGVEVTEEIRKKHRDAKRGRTLTDEHKKNIRISAIGRIFTDEHKKNLSLAGKMKTLSNEHKRKISDSMAGEKHHFFNKQHTEESKIKNAISHLGEEVFYQRLKDIEEIDGVYGYKAKLARKWGVVPSAVSRFIKKWVGSNILQNIRKEK